MTKFSIITPVYNNANYMQQCINSVLNQTYNSYELILIDDGSTDGSEEICKYYSDKYKKIKYFHQPNKGVSAARNVGISKSDGDYIVFLDSDDYIKSDYLSDLALAIQKSTADIIINVSINLHYDNKIVSKKLFSIENVNNYQHYQKLEYMFSQFEVPGAAWHNVYKKFLISKGVKFNERLKSSEDADFFYQALFKTSNIFFVDKSDYYYRMNNNTSVTNNNSKNYLLDNLNTNLYWLIYFENNNFYTKNTQNIIKSYFAKHLILLIDSAYVLNKTDYINFKNIILENKTLTEALAFKYRIIRIIIKLLSPPVYSKSIFYIRKYILKNL